MKILDMLWTRLKLAFFRRAMAEIDPMHPDVPELIHTINALEHHWARLATFQPALPDLSVGRG